MLARAERVGMRLFGRLACRAMLGMRVGMSLSLGVVSGGDDRAGCRSLLAERAGRRLFVVRAGNKELGERAPRKVASCPRKPNEYNYEGFHRQASSTFTR